MRFNFEWSKIRGKLILLWKFTITSDWNWLEFPLQTGSIVVSFWLLINRVYGGVGIRHIARARKTDLLLDSWFRSLNWRQILLLLRSCLSSVLLPRFWRNKSFLTPSTLPLIRGNWSTLHDWNERSPLLLSSHHIPQITTLIRIHRDVSIRHWTVTWHILPCYIWWGVGHWELNVQYMPKSPSQWVFVCRAVVVQILRLNTNIIFIAKIFQLIGDELQIVDVLMRVKHGLPLQPHCLKLE